MDTGFLMVSLQWTYFTEKKSRSVSIRVICRITYHITQSCQSSKAMTQTVECIAIVIAWRCILLECHLPVLISKIHIHTHIQIQISSLSLAICVTKANYLMSLFLSILINKIFNNWIIIKEDNNSVTLNIAPGIWYIYYTCKNKDSNKGNIFLIAVFVEIVV